MAQILYIGKEEDILNTIITCDYSFLARDRRPKLTSGYIKEIILEDSSKLDGLVV